MSVKIQINKLTNKERSKINDELLLILKNDSKMLPDKEIQPFDIINNDIYLPFNYACNELTYKRPERNFFSSMNVKFEGKLRDEQIIVKKEAVEKLGVHFQTLRNWDKDGKIKTIRSPGGKRFYDIKTFIKNTDENLNLTNTLNNKIDDRKKICYCRVSSYSQKDELVHQVDYMKLKYPKHEILTDIGSGINFNRGNLKKIIDYAINNILEELVVSYKDRLCRIGYDLIEYILKEYSNTKIIIEKDEDKSPEKELTEDLIEIITVFSSRLYGMRSYKINKPLKNSKK